MTQVGGKTTQRPKRLEQRERERESLRDQGKEKVTRKKNLSPNNMTIKSICFAVSDVDYVYIGVCLAMFIVNMNVSIISDKSSLIGEKRSFMTFHLQALQSHQFSFIDVEEVRGRENHTKMFWIKKIKSVWWHGNPRNYSKACDAYKRLDWPGIPHKYTSLENLVQLGHDTPDSHRKRQEIVGETCVDDDDDAS